jgi:crossover junction endodeoxyribonuclease RuvC
MGVSLREFERMRQRTTGRRAETQPAIPAPVAVGGDRNRVILGVDPSLRGTGYGVIREGKPSPQALAAGVVACPRGWERSRCLARIAGVLREMVAQHRPSLCVLEGLFYAQNLRTALVLGEARGAALLTVAEAGLDVYELAPRKVKQAIVGYGAAQKTAVARMVQRLLGLAEVPAPDAADALALALAYSLEQGRYGLTPLKRL